MIRMWVARTWFWVVPLFLIAHWVDMMNVPAPSDIALPLWSLDWSWMLSYWAGGTLLLSPIAAGVAVFLVGKGFPPDARAVVSPLPRGARPAFDIWAAVWLQGFAVQAVTLAIASLFCWVQGGDPRGVTLPWQLVTAPVALGAAVGVGVLAALVVPRAWTLPAVVLGLFLGHRLFYTEGYPELFTLEAAGYIVHNARPMPRHLASTVALNLVVGLMLALLVRFVLRVRGSRGAWLYVVGAGALLVSALAIVLPWVWWGTGDTYEMLP